MAIILRTLRQGHDTVVGMPGHGLERMIRPTVVPDVRERLRQLDFTDIPAFNRKSVDAGFLLECNEQFGIPFPAIVAIDDTSPLGIPLLALELAITLVAKAGATNKVDGHEFAILENRFEMVEMRIVG